MPYSKIGTTWAVVYYLITFDPFKFFFQFSIIL